LPRQVVYWDLRDEFLEQLYRHKVAGARLGPLLARIDGILGGMVCCPDRTNQAPAQELRFRGCLDGTMGRCDLGAA
jgi:hypothetical protein